MINRNLLLLIFSILLTVTFWIFSTALIGNKPNQVRDLEDEITELNEQLISAQILANKLDRVYTLVEKNLALSIQDSLAEDASIPFLNDLTGMLENLGIKVQSIQPKKRIENIGYVESPYDLLIICTYKQLGSFMAEIERSPRLIKVNEFTVENGVERVKNISRAEDLKTQLVEINLSTITLLKSSDQTDEQI